MNYNPFASVDDGSCCFGAYIQFNMFDSFGDGWNGATYSFYDADGNLVAEGGLLSNENDGESIPMMSVWMLQAATPSL